MSIDNVRKYFKEYNLDGKIKEFDSSSATVELAAKCLNCDPANIAKSMAFILDKPIIVVLAGDVKVDNSKYKKEFGKKAKMLVSEELLKYIGHSIGGVCPFAINKEVQVYLDMSLKRFEYVYPACGSANSAIKLSIKELEKYSNYIKWIDISKQKDN